MLNGIAKVAQNFNSANFFNKYLQVFTKNQFLLWEGAVNGMQMHIYPGCADRTKYSRGMVRCRL